jgi:hypothetical protein
MLNQETAQAARRIDHPAKDNGQQPLQTARYNLRPNRNRDYRFRLDCQMDNPDNDKYYKLRQFLQDVAETDDKETVQSHTLREAVENRSDSSSRPAIVKSVVGIILNQMAAKVGIKKHGKVAGEALFDEFLQLHDLHVFDPCSASPLTRAQKRPHSEPSALSKKSAAEK